MADIGATYDGVMAEIVRLRTELEAKDKRIAELEEISARAINSNQKYYREKVLAEQRIADAPHDMDCASLGLLQLYPEECTCWKSK